MLMEGVPLEDPASFVQRLNRMMSLSVETRFLARLGASALGASRRTACAEYIYRVTYIYMITRAAAEWF